jgi:hypothetical protein
MDIDRAFRALISPFLEIVGPAARLCKICGDPPWRHDEAWCAAVHDGMDRRAKARARPQPRTPQVTIEALVYQLREHGLPELAKPDCQERLAALSSDQLRELIGRLMGLRPKYLAITDDLLLALGEQI